MDGPLTYAAGDKLVVIHPIPRLLLTSAEVAECLGFSERTIRYLVDAGELKARKVKIPGRGKARALRFKWADVLAWVEQQPVAAEEARVFIRGDKGRFATA